MVTEAQGELEGPTFIDEDSSRAQGRSSCRHVDVSVYFQSTGSRSTQNM